MSDEWNIIDIEKCILEDYEQKPLLELKNISNISNINNINNITNSQKKRERSSSLGSLNQVNYIISGNGILEQKINKRLKIDIDKFLIIKFNYLNKKQKFGINKINITNIKYLFFIFVIIFCIVTLFSFYLCLKRIEENKFYESQIITNSTIISLPPNLRFMCKYWIKEKVTDLPEYCNYLSNK
jgi:hypothetical protein